MPEPRITEEQANEALKQIQADVLEEETGQVAAQPAETAAEAEPSAEATPAAETAETATEEAEATETDDVASLKTRLAERDAKIEEQEKQFKDREEALKTRYSANERILRERYVRKSNLTDKALKTIERIRNDPGVPEAEVDQTIQELRSSMNPSSPSYVPPETPKGTDDHFLIVNDFLNEKGMTTAEADAFGNWVTSEGKAKLTPVEQAVADRDLDGFLRIAHRAWRDDTSEHEKDKRTTDAVNAVKSVQRTQKEAARAAAATPTAPRKQPVGPKTTVDTKSLTQKDVSTLLRQSVEQYE